MANHWDITDAVLTEQLQKWVDYLISLAATWRVHLFKNNYEPQPNMTLANLTAATFPGYSYKTFNTNTFATPVAMAAHVASSLSSAVNVFLANSSGFSSETIYGYYVTDGSGTLKWAESFGTPQIVVPDYQVTVQVKMEHRVYPNPL